MTERVPTSINDLAWRMVMDSDIWPETVGDTEHVIVRAAPGVKHFLSGLVKDTLNRPVTDTDATQPAIEPEPLGDLHDQLVDEGSAWLDLDGESVDTLQTLVRGSFQSNSGALAPAQESEAHLPPSNQGIAPDVALAGLARRRAAEMLEVSEFLLGGGTPTEPVEVSPF